VKQLCVGLAVFALAGVASADAKADLLKAIAEAKKAGLPTTMADYLGPKPSAATLQLEKLIKRGEALSRGRPTLAETVTIDIQNVERKRKGLKELPYPQDSAGATKKRLSEYRQVIAQIGKSTAPRARAQSLFASITLFSSALDDANLAVQTKNPKALVANLLTARRLIELIPTNNGFIPRARQQAAEQKYYRFLEKLAKDNRALAAQVPASCLAQIKKPPLNRLVPDEFFGIFSTIVSAPANDPNSWDLPADKKTMDMVAEICRQYTIVYRACKNANSRTELAAGYKSVESKMTTFEAEGFEDPTMHYGPVPGVMTYDYDRYERKRLEILKTWPGRR
jgi:hypothetical protein